jgi:hypothetical protein
MNWLYYLGEANLYLIVFYIGYCLFLANETHYTLNRIYLLSSCVLAFVLPVLQLGFLKPVPSFPVAVTDPNRYPDGPELWEQNLVLVYVCGACLFAILFLVKLFKLWVLIRQSYISKMAKHKLIHIDDSNTAFSFFNYLFIAEEIESVDFITGHELVHIRQKHSADIIFTEILKVISWFNPVAYLLQRSLKNVHEFIADEKTVADNNDRLAYSAFLINSAYGLSGTSITHSFFNNNLLKRRILMLNAERSGKSATFKYLMIAPLFLVMLCASTLSFSKTYGWFDVAPAQQQAPPPPPTPPVAHSARAIHSTKRNIIRFPPPVVKRNGHANTKPKVDHVKFPPPAVKPVASAKAAKPKVDQVKFPPPVVKHVASTKSAKPKVDQVKFPPPAKSSEQPDSKQIDKRPPPPPPAPPSGDGR